MGPNAVSEYSRILQTHTLLREQEVADFLNLKVATLRRWRWSGDGPPFIKLNGAVRYRRSDLEAYIDAQRRHSTSDTSNSA